MSVYDHGESTDGRPFVVMEYVDGRSLREILDANGPRSERRALSIAADLCAALDHAHRQDVVHGGIQPGTVLITGAKETKLTDFGLATLGRGTALTMSPEQSMGQRADARSDLYAVGCVLFEMLTGEPVFAGDRAILIAAKHSTEKPRLPSQVRPKVSKAADEVVRRALQKDPADRFQSADEMRAALVDAREGRTSPPRRVRVGPRPTPPVRRTVTRQLPPKPTRRLTRTVFPATPPVELRGKNLSVLGMRQTGRRDEPHGEDVYTFNNAKSSSSSVETIHAAHTAKVEVGIDTSRSRTVGGKIGVKFVDLAGVEAKIQREILTRRTLSMSKEISYNQTTAVHILPSTHVRVRIRWKLMWEDGVVTVGAGGQQVEVPYSITVGLKFDKDTEDVT